MTGQPKTTSMGGRPAAPTLTIRWIGAIFGVTLVLLVVAAAGGNLADLSVAFAWLIAISALYLALDPAHGNLFGGVP